MLEHRTRLRRRLELAAAGADAVLVAIVEGILGAGVAEVAGAVLVKFPVIVENGPFHVTLREVLAGRGAESWVSQRYSRAYLRRDEGWDWERYQREILSKNLRKQVRRQRRQIEKLGRVEHVFLESHDDIDAWTFLAVADLHLTRGLAIQTGPGVEVLEEGEEFVVRVGLLYEFELGEGWTLSPQVHYDWTQEEDTMVYGLAFGRAF